MRLALSLLSVFLCWQVVTPSLTGDIIIHGKESEESEKKIRIEESESHSLEREKVINVPILEVATEKVPVISEWSKIGEVSNEGLKGISGQIDGIEKWSGKHLPPVPVPEHLQLNKHPHIPLPSMEPPNIPLPPIVPPMIPIPRPKPHPTKHPWITPPPIITLPTIEHHTKPHVTMHHNHHTRPPTTECETETTTTTKPPPTMHHTKPPTMHHTKPTTMRHTKPTTMRHTKPTTMRHTKPTTMRHTKPPTTECETETPTTTERHTKPPTTMHHTKPPTTMHHTKPPTTMHHHTRPPPIIHHHTKPTTTTPPPTTKGEDDCHVQIDLEILLKTIKTILKLLREGKDLKSIWTQLEGHGGTANLQEITVKIVRILKLLNQGENVKGLDLSSGSKDIALLKRIVETIVLIVKSLDSGKQGHRGQNLKKIIWELQRNIEKVIWMCERQWSGKGGEGWEVINSDTHSGKLSKILPMLDKLQARGGEGMLDLENWKKMAGGELDIGALKGKVGQLLDLSKQGKDITSLLNSGNVKELGLGTVDLKIITGLMDNLSPSKLEGWPIGGVGLLGPDKIKGM